MSRTLRGERKGGTRGRKAPGCRPGKESYLTLTPVQAAATPLASAESAP